MSDKQTQADWAPQEWFAAQAKDDGAASYFGHTQNGYQRFRHARLAKMLDTISSTLGRSSMLDVGCATGALTNHIKQCYKFQRCVGVDFVPEVLELGRTEFPSIEFIEAALPDLPFKDGEFDLVIASEVLYYLTPNAQKKAINTLAHVLRPGGYLLVGSVLGGEYFTPEGIRDLMLSDFDIVSEDWLHMRPYHTLVSPFFYSTRLESILSSGTQPGSPTMQAKLRRLRPALEAFPLRNLIRITANIGSHILASEQLPELANRFARPSPPSNIALLARRH